MRCLKFCALIVLLAASAGHCSKIAGRVVQRGTNRAIKGAAVLAYAEGRSVCRGASTDSDGRYVIDNLAPGRYAVCTPQTEDSRPQVTAVDVPADGEAQVDFRLGPTLAVDGDSWLQGYPVFHQSFTAAGLGVTGLRLKGFGPGKVVTVQVVEGDGPGGRPIGPPRTTAKFGMEGQTAVYWSGGEVPTVPGKRYTFEMRAQEGQVWIPGVAGRGDVYSGGSAYFGGDPRPYSDLGFSLCEENDNLAVSFAVAPGQRAVMARAVGQTFAARSTDVLYASASLANIRPQTVYVRFSIHEGGPQGRQIGPSKGVRVGENAAVAWLPGEVELEVGKTYYLHIESYNGSRFYAYEDLDPYAGGTAYNDAVKDETYDLAAWTAGSMGAEDIDALFAHPKRVKIVPLANASFESPDKCWMLTRDFGSTVGCDGGVIPPWGSRMFGWTNKKEGQDWRTVVWQFADVEAGKRYAFSGWVYTDHIGGRSSDQKIRLVVNPRGEAEFTGETMTSSQWYCTEGEWRRGSVEFTALADRITVGFELEQRWSLDMCSLYCDAAQLEEIRED